MNRVKWVLLSVGVLLMCGTAGGLTWLKANQRLGIPGIKGTPKAGVVMWDIDLPANVAGFSSETLPEGEEVLVTLPKDTSYAQRVYKATNGFWAQASIVLMGMDRTSIHKPEFCLPAQGFQIEDRSIVNLAIGGPTPYTLPVAKWRMSRMVQLPDGTKAEQRALYVFWFVADNEQTVSHWQRLWWLSRDLLRTGVLQRWAYVSYFTAFAPGQEDLVFGELSKLIVASVPEFQNPPRNPSTGTVANR